MSVHACKTHRRASCVCKLGAWVDKTVDMDVPPLTLWRCTCTVILASARVTATTRRDAIRRAAAPWFFAIADADAADAKKGYMYKRMIGARQALLWWW